MRAVKENVSDILEARRSAGAYEKCGEIRLSKWLNKDCLDIREPALLNKVFLLDGDHMVGTTRQRVRHVLLSESQIEA